MMRTVRGGSWRDGEAVYVRSTYRKEYPEDSAHNFVGFRCAASLIAK
jgi:formylglycine-generating enzyme required for sulfatase activity